MTDKTTPERQPVADALPPLPASQAFSLTRSVYTADDMHAYARAALASRDAEIADVKALLDANFGSGWEDFDAAALRVRTRERDEARAEIAKLRQGEPVEMSPEFTDTARAALLWVLWHHQGSSSPVGQPLRFALGMGAHDHLNDRQVSEAKRWAAISKSSTADFHTSRLASPPPAQPPQAEPSQGWQQEAVMLREQLHQERNTNELLRSQNGKNYWAWQGDGSDHLERQSLRGRLHAGQRRLHQRDSWHLGRREGAGIVSTDECGSGAGCLHKDARIKSQAAQIAALKTVMIAAAEEIAAHWEAHCDAEGYGPQNLLRRLEEGIPSEYGYTAGAFAALTAERDALRADAERWRYWRNFWPALCRMEVARFARLDLSRAYVQSPADMDAVTDAARASLSPPSAKEMP